MAEEKEKDLFEEQPENSQEPIEEVDEELQERDDIKEGLMAESDPRSQMSDPSQVQNKPAKDLGKESLKTRVTNMGRKAGEELNQKKKVKVMVPIDELSPEDEHVVVGTQGWNMQIKRGEPAMVPEPIVRRLVESGYNPTLVP